MPRTKIIILGATRILATASPSTQTGMVD
jgi:hypothetical protein